MEGPRAVRTLVALCVGAGGAEEGNELLRGEEAVALRQQFAEIFPVGLFVICQHHGHKTRPPTRIEGMARGHQVITLCASMERHPCEGPLLGFPSLELGQRPATDAPAESSERLFLVRLREMSAGGTDTLNDRQGHSDLVQQGVAQQGAAVDGSAPRSWTEGPRHHQRELLEPKCPAMVSIPHVHDNVSFIGANRIQPALGVLNEERLLKPGH